MTMRWQQKPDEPTDYRGLGAAENFVYRVSIVSEDMCRDNEYIPEKIGRDKTL